MEYLALWLICGIGAALIASSRGGSGGWFFIGLVLGPIGLLLALTEGKRCPHCQSKIHVKATTCPKCQMGLPVIEKSWPSARAQEPPPLSDAEAEALAEPWPRSLIVFLVLAVILMIAYFAEYSG